MLMMPWGHYNNFYKAIELAIELHVEVYDHS
jgi:hypothetical protein